MARDGSFKLPMEEPVMATAALPRTDFTLDVLGRYICNTLDDYYASIDPRARNGGAAHPEARHADTIILGGGTFGAVMAARLFGREP